MQVRGEKVRPRRVRAAGGAAGAPWVPHSAFASPAGLVIVVAAGALGESPRLFLLLAARDALAGHRAFLAAEAQRFDFHFELLKSLEARRRFIFPAAIAARTAQPASVPCLQS